MGDSFRLRDLLFGSANEATTTYIPTTANSTDMEAAAYQATDAATVPVLIVIVVIIVIVAAAVFIHVKLRNKRQADSQRRAQLRMSTTNNAGVYVDLSPPEDALGASKQHPHDPESQGLKKNLQD